VSSGQAIVVEDVRQDPRFARDVAETTGYLPSSILAVPLPGGADGLGVLEVLDRTRVDGRDDLRLGGLLARQAALAIEIAGAADAASDLLVSPAAVALAALAAAGDPELAAATGLLQGLRDYVEAKRGYSGLV
jgi:GAF domain-containing protein